MTLLLEFLTSLRSIRHFTDRPVSREQIDQILDVARWTDEDWYGNLGEDAVGSG